jgi:hypothetical protein
MTMIHPAQFGHDAIRHCSEIPVAPEQQGFYQIIGNFDAMPSMVS